MRIQIDSLATRCRVGTRTGSVAAACGGIVLAEHEMALLRTLRNQAVMALRQAG